MEFSELYLTLGTHIKLQKLMKLFLAAGALGFGAMSPLESLEKSAQGKTFIPVITDLCN